MKRPEHLPEFNAPPLDEVVLGVQFSPIQSYTSVDSWDIWALFKDEFPKVQEQPLLPRQFETFGGPLPQPSIQFQVGAPIGSRLLFISMEENQLLQFQSDRFLMNWRKNPNHQPYPRFEGIVEAFKTHLTSLAKHLESELIHTISINQVEVSYINIIPVNNFADAKNWFNVWNIEVSNIDNLNMGFQEIIKDDTGQPYARLFHAIQPAYTIEGNKVFNLSLTFRGKPRGNDVASAINFLRIGREAIVFRFKQMTTDSAHANWELQS